ncbi:MAG TPA: LPS export ABC transporter periplasmic protein LptC [Steroidobacteraceae bacterium]|nr:LPS export ABC transporter periplasmic protein LptC [Steroidobacteraceae bacterium]
MRIPSPVAFACLTALAAVSWWLAQRDAESPQAPAVVTQPGYYLKNAALEQTDASGRLTLRVHAAAATEVEQHGDVQLRLVSIDYLPEPGRDWRITAATGTLPPAGRSVQLEGDVRLTSPTEGGALLRTEHLYLDVDQQLATTADPVRIEFPPHVLNARGLRADLKRETLRLESSVNGTFTR